MESTAGKPTGHLCLSKPRPPPTSSVSRHPGPMGRTYAVKTSYKHSTKKRTRNPKKRQTQGNSRAFAGCCKTRPSPPRACNVHHPTWCASDTTGMVVRQSKCSETHRRDVVDPRFIREHYAFGAADGLNGNARPLQRTGTVHVCLRCKPFDGMLRLHRIHRQHGCATPWNLEVTETEQADSFGTNHGDTEHTERRHGRSVRFIVQSPGDQGFRRAARADPSTAGATSHGHQAFAPVAGQAETPRHLGGPSPIGITNTPGTPPRRLCPQPSLVWDPLRRC